MDGTFRAVGPEPGRRPGSVVDGARPDRALLDEARRTARELAHDAEVFRARAQALRRQLEIRRTWLASDLASSAQCLAGQRAVGRAVALGEPAGGEAPLGRDRGDGGAVAGRGIAELLVGPTEPELSQVGQRGGDSDRK